jgi:hypothetical protein
MEFCITRVDGEGGTRLRIDGQLGRDGLGELRRAWEDAKHPVTIELSGLCSADDSALALLRQLRVSGAALVGASQYLLLRLDSGAAGS